MNCSSGQKFVNTSNWVGLDGFENQTVEQDGTDAYCAGSGNHTAKYYAWIDMYPLPEVNPFAVSPGNVISALVKSTPSGTFTLTITDLTSGRQRPRSRTGRRTTGRLPSGSSSARATATPPTRSASSRLSPASAGPR